MKLLYGFWTLIFPLAALAGAEPTKPTTRPSTIGAVAASADEVMPLRVDERIPAVVLETVDAKPFDLAAEITKTPAVLIFYRGGWCPFCNQQMSGLQGIVKDLHEAGYQLLAISPDLPTELAKSAAKHSLTYTLLSDSKVKAIKGFGLAFHVSDETYRHMTEFGVDLEKATGEKDHVLPVPAVYILGTDGLIRFVHFDPNFKQRMDPAEILKEAKLALLKSSPAVGNVRQ